MPRAYPETLTIRASGSAGRTTLAGTIRVEGSFITLLDMEVDAGGGDRDAVRIDTGAHAVWSAG